jgi:formylglycine-generating enzyme
MTQQVFISYSNKNETDRQVADKIYNTLKVGGIPCWVAHRDIGAGQNWLDEISKAISNSRVMIVVLSNFTEKSPYVKKEVGQAAEENLIIIPFCTEKVSLTGGLRLLLNDCQWINAHLMRQDKALEQLVEDLRRYLGIEPGKTPKQEEKPLEVYTQSFRKNSRTSLRRKLILWAASIIIAVIAVVFIIKGITPVKNTTGTAKPGDTLADKTIKTKPAEDAPKNTAAKPVGQPDFVSDLKSKGWDVKKNENDCWEAFYKAYDLTMIYIPPGKFMMGADDISDAEKPLHEVDLDGYWIGKYEVTFAQYDRYCKETGKEKPGDAGWGREKRPVINVSWDEAAAYCLWLSQKTVLTFQLPTESQWEKAARGTGGLIYPWGNDFDKNKCNSYESGLKKTMPVGSYPLGKSPYGCMDMAGNVWEWCADWYNEGYYKNSHSKNPPGPEKGECRVLRGGYWFDVAPFCRAAYRFAFRPADRYGFGGFRLSRSL